MSGFSKAPNPNLAPRDKGQGKREVILPLIWCGGAGSTHSAPGIPLMEKTWFDGLEFFRVAESRLGNASTANYISPLHPHKSLERVPFPTPVTPRKLSFLSKENEILFGGGNRGVFVGPGATESPLNFP